MAREASRGRIRAANRHAKTGPELASLLESTVLSDEDEDKGHESRIQRHFRRYWVKT